MEEKEKGDENNIISAERYIRETATGEKQKWSKKPLHRLTKEEEEWERAIENEDIF